MKLVCLLVEDDDACDWMPDGVLSAVECAPDDLLDRADWELIGRMAGLAFWRAQRVAAGLPAFERAAQPKE